LYYRYAKSGMNIQSIIKSAGLGGEGVGPDSAVIADESTELPEDRLSKIDEVAQILSIKQKKRESIDMKIMRESIMGLAKGDMGDMSSLLDSLGGEGGGIPDLSQLNPKLSRFNRKL
jgi:hypothetical protein